MAGRVQRQLQWRMCRVRMRFFIFENISHARLYTYGLVLFLCWIIFKHHPSFLGIPEKTLSTLFNPPGYAPLTRSVLLTAQSRSERKCLEATGFGLVFIFNRITKYLKYDQFHFSDVPSDVDDANGKSFWSMATFWRNRYCRNSIEQRFHLSK